MKIEKNIIITVSLLFTLILVSGCIGIPDVFGRDVISVQQNTVQNGDRDVIVIKDIITIPKSPLLPNQQLLLSFIVENRDNLKNTRAVVDLFNAPTMRSADGTNSCNLYVASSSESSVQQRYCEPDNCGVPNGCVILPGEEKQINFPLRTPREDEIKNIKTDTKLDFKVTYAFDGSLTYLVPAISTEEIVKRQRSGDKTTLFTSKSYSSGPVQVDVELRGAPYMLSNEEGNQPETVLLFSIKNKGSGNIVNSEIEGGGFEVLFPPEFDVIRNRNWNEQSVENERFTCNVDSAGTRCTTNTDESGVIPLYRDESRSSLLFTVKLREPLLEPFRTFQVSANVRYNYELRSSVALTINPFQNV